MAGYLNLAPRRTDPVSALVTCTDPDGTSITGTVTVRFLRSVAGRERVQLWRPAPSQAEDIPLKAKLNGETVKIGRLDYEFYSDDYGHSWKRKAGSRLDYLTEAGSTEFTLETIRKAGALLKEWAADWLELNRFWLDDDRFAILTEELDAARRRAHGTDYALLKQRGEIEREREYLDMLEPRLKKLPARPSGAEMFALPRSERKALTAGQEDWDYFDNSEQRLVEHEAALPALVQANAVSEQQLNTSQRALEKHKQALHDDTLGVASKALDDLLANDLGF